MTYESQALDAGGLELSATEATESRSGTLVPTEPLGRDFSRLASGLALAAIYGLALGVRSGGPELVRHALGAPLGLAVVAAVAAPALFVRLALINAPLRPAQMVGAVAQGTFTAGLVLAGLAPAVAMLVVSIESAAAAAWMSGLGLWLAGGIGLFNLLAALRQHLIGTDFRTSSRGFVAVAIFSALACALAARAWYAWLPLLGGAS
jgi:hypothetical protein